MSEFIPQEEKLFKAYGVLWRSYSTGHGRSYIVDNALCRNQDCQTTLKPKGDAHYCVKCDKNYPYKVSHVIDRESVEKIWEGHKTLDWRIYSLELPPTKIVGEDEDENYWIKVKLSEKSGKRMAVIYFGEKKKNQDKTDYSQVFVDFEDEQIRFDKNNKNPMKILCKFTAEFPNSEIRQRKKKK